MSIDAAVAATRFGMGARGEEIADLADDPRGALKAQLGASSAVEGAGLASSAEAAQTTFT